MMSWFKILKKEKKSILNHPIIGGIPIIVHPRAKSLKLKCTKKGISITTPKFVSKKTIESFFYTNENWAIKHFEKWKSIINKPKLKVGDEFEIGEGFVCIHHNNLNWNINNTDIQILYNDYEHLTKIIIELCRKEAKRLLIERVESFAEKNGVKFNKLTFKRIKTRWGSCSSKNNINLSVFLVRLPEELSDYVILHELCHLVHKNHSKHFWNLLETWCPNALQKDKQLRNYNHVIL